MVAWRSIEQRIFFLCKSLGGNIFLKPQIHIGNFVNFRAYLVVYCGGWHRKAEPDVFVLGRTGCFVADLTRTHAISRRLSIAELRRGR
jgi:hypothetical protein